MSDQKPLNIADEENAQKAVLSLILQYDGFPFELDNTNVLFDNIPENKGIGLFTLSGGAYTQTYVSGNYTAQFPFRIVYKSSPTKNKDSIKAQNDLQKLSEWLEKCSATFSDKHLQFQKITRTSPVYELGVDEKSKQYSCTMQLEYFYRK